MPLRLDLLLPRRAPRFSRRYRGKGASQCFRLVPWRNIQASHSSFVRMTGMVFCLLYPPESRHQRSRLPRPFRADIVAKVENRATQKILPKPISGLLCCCIACQRHCGDPWSILNKTIWSVTSPRVKRISGSKNSRASPQKEFCNNICQQATSTMQ
jgi:hypothetical protein